MEIVAHRINTIEGLRKVPREFGVELDIRADGSVLILNHEPFQGGNRFVDYLENYNHGLMVLNIKEAGIETEVLKLVRARGIKRHFLLDVEFPYLFRASRAGERAIAVRYSEDECIETAARYAGKVDWVWIDTISRLPLTPEVLPVLKRYMTCLVCPERWGRPQDIPAYRAAMKKMNFAPDAVMTSLAHAKEWEKQS